MSQIKWAGINIFLLVSFIGTLVIRLPLSSDASMPFTFPPVIISMNSLVEWTE